MPETIDFATSPGVALKARLVQFQALREVGYGRLRLAAWRFRRILRVAVEWRLP